MMDLNRDEQVPSRAIRLVLSCVSHLLQSVAWWPWLSQLVLLLLLTATRQTPESLVSGRGGDGECLRVAPGTQLLSQHSATEGD